MAGIKGLVTKAKGGKQRSVYLSDTFGIWPEGKALHIAMLRGEQQLHTSITARDGLLYDVMMMLWQHGQRAGTAAIHAATPPT